MAIPLKVLGDRVLVKPDVIDNAPETTESGVVIAKSLAAAVTGSDPQQSINHGTVVGIDEEFPGGDPPLHPNCRCDVLPVLKEKTDG